MAWPSFWRTQLCLWPDKRGSTVDCSWQGPSPCGLWYPNPQAT